LLWSWWAILVLGAWRPVALWFVATTLLLSPALLLPWRAWLATLPLLIAGRSILLLRPVALRLCAALLLRAPLRSATLLGFRRTRLTFALRLCATFGILRPWLLRFPLLLAATLALLLRPVASATLLLARTLIATGVAGLLFLPVVLFQRLQCYLAHVIHIAHINLGVAGLIELFLQLNRLQVFYLLALLVEALNFLHAHNRERVLLIVIGEAIPHQVLEDVALLQVCNAFHCFQRIGMIREYGKGVHISIQLIIEAALQPAALAG